MRIFFTTEQELINILGSSEDDVWKEILMKQQTVFVSLPSGRTDWDETNPILNAFHRSGKQIHAFPDFFDRIKNDKSNMTIVSTPIYLLDISKDEAEKIRREYGVCCYAIGSKIKPFVAKRGWSIDTSDGEKPNSWDFFYNNITPYCNSIIIIDRFLFACEYNKKNDEPDEIIQDSYDNLEQIMRNILPQESKCRDFVLTIVFSYSSNKGGRGEETPTLTEIIEEIQNIKERINRPYDYNIEVLSIDKGCAYYNDTHDRFVITNYSVTEAAHKLKAFRKENVSLCKQKISFDYSYSKGIEEDDKSSLPVTTQRILYALRKYVNDEENKKIIKYALNGEVYTFEDEGVKNKMLNSEL